MAEIIKEKEDLVCGYPIEIYEEIFDILSTSEKGIKTICEGDKRFPSYSSVYRAIIRSGVLSHKYARAREAQFNVLTDAMRQEIDDANPNDRFGIEKLKLKVQNLHWTASKLARRKYGDRVSIDVDLDATIKQLCVHLDISESDFRRVSEKIAKGELDFGKPIEIEAGENEVKES